MVYRSLQESLLLVESDDYQQDFKSILQEKAQSKFHSAPQYRIVETLGSDHDRTFVAQVQVGNRTLGEGAGKSKKEAEQAAAKLAMELLLGEQKPSK